MYKKILEGVNVFNPIATAYNFGKLSSALKDKEKYSTGTLSDDPSLAGADTFILFVFFIIFIVFVVPYILNFYYAYKNWNIMDTVWKVVWVLSLIMFGPIISGIVLITAIAASKG